MGRVPRGWGVLTESSEFFGELYFETTVPFFTPERDTAEAAYLARAFAHVDVGPIVDLGCGHGRHLKRLQQSVPEREWVGLESDAYALERLLPGVHAVRGDVQALPFEPASLAGAYAWYSTFNSLGAVGWRGALKQVRRCLKPSGLLVFQTVNPGALAQAPKAFFSRPLPQGGAVREHSVFDAALGVDTGRREWTNPEGQVRSASYSLWYPDLQTLKSMLADAGFSLSFVHEGVEEVAASPYSREWIVGANVE